MDTVRSNLSDFSPPGITGRTRVFLWVLFLGMTAALILYPANLKYEYSIHVIPFIYIFDNFSLFAALYYLWLLLLLVLLFTRGSEGRTDWEKAALVGIFALVFTGYSALMSRGLLGDSFTPAGDIKNFMGQGHFALAPSLKYHGFPGFSLLGAGVCLITGLDITDYMSFFPFFQVLLFSMLIYLFFNKLLKNPYFASLGALLMIQVDMSVATTLPGFHAGAFTPYCLLMLALLLFAAGRDTEGRRVFGLETNEALILAVLVALAISHFITSVVVFFTILCIYIIQKLSGKRVLSTQLMVLALLVPTIWNLAENLTILRYFGGMVPKALAELTSGEIINNWLLPLQTTSLIGERAPLWTILPLYLGPLFVIIGGMLGLARLFKVKHLEREEVITLSGLAGVVVLAIILLFLGSLEESYGRTLIYVAFFTVPIIFGWIFHFKNLRKYVFSLLVGVILLLSLPAFLLSSKAIAGATYYPREVASGEFLESSYGNGSGLHLYGMEGSVYYLTYYLPYAYLNMANPPKLRSTNLQDIWQNVNEYVSTMEEATSENLTTPAGVNIIMFSPKWDTPFREYVGVEVKNSPEWQQLRSRLAGNNLIYDNGFVQVYERQL